jgi:hypothetical protein
MFLPSEENRMIRFCFKCGESLEALNKTLLEVPIHVDEYYCSSCGVTHQADEILDDWEKVILELNQLKDRVATQENEIQLLKKELGY